MSFIKPFISTGRDYIRVLNSLIGAFKIKDTRNLTDSGHRSKQSLWKRSLNSRWVSPLILRAYRWKHGSANV
jgi:hypothetical protein